MKKEIDFIQQQIREMGNNCPFTPLEAYKAATNLANGDERLFWGYIYDFIVFRTLDPSQFREWRGINSRDFFIESRMNDY